MHGYGISIHAPLRERPISKSAIKGHKNFNPRSLTGATLVRYMAHLDNPISIHAPLRERPCWRIIQQGKSRFQSTLPYGSDLPTASKFQTFFLFQSTLPYGSDLPNWGLPYAMFFHFNPRSLTGATYVAQISEPSASFQSTLPYGSDKTLKAQRDIAAISIHAPLRERRKISRTFIADYSLTGATPLRERPRSLAKR